MNAKTAKKLRKLAKQLTQNKHTYTQTDPSGQVIVSHESVRGIYMLLKESVSTLEANGRRLPI